MSGGRVLLKVNQRLNRELAEMGGARKPEMVETATLVKRSLRKVLGVKGHGKPAPPGQPPRQQKGNLRKSIVSGVVGAGQRVGLTSFVAPLQEFGVDTKADGAAPRSRKNLFTGATREVKKASAQAAARRNERRNQVARRKSGRGAGNIVGDTSKVRHEQIDARPFMQQALDDAGLDRIVDVQVNAIRRRLPGGD
ncbi:MAG TPA: hypothetical protein PK308_00100 [Phycisphaerales bacterium]|nr:hypothetical protein [Phycisphaerales bacterium]